MTTKNIIVKTVIIGIIILTAWILPVFAGQAKPQASQVPISQANLKVPLFLVGMVKYEGKGLKDIAIRLDQIGGTGKVMSGVQQTFTNEAGQYSFTIGPEHYGQNFSVTPKYGNLSPGMYFNKTNEIVTMNGNKKVDFLFQPPSYKVKGYVARTGSNSNGIRNVEITLDEVLGPNKYKLFTQTTTPASGYYNFDLPYEKFNKKFRMRFHHPQAIPAGQYFTPKEVDFMLTGDMNFHIIYNGPLPDLMISNAQFIPNVNDPGKMIFTIKNQGGIAAAGVAVELSYNEIEESANAPYPAKIITKMIPGLAAGASYELIYSFPKIKTIKNKFFLLRVDRWDALDEDNKVNNRLAREDL